MLKDLLKVANKLDALGLNKEADAIDSLVRKIASKDNITRMDAYREPSESFLPLKSKRPSESSGSDSKFSEMISANLKSAKSDKHMIDSASYRVPPEALYPYQNWASAFVMTAHHLLSAHRKGQVSDEPVAQLAEALRSLELASSGSDMEIIRDYISEYGNNLSEYNRGIVESLMGDEE